ncbi:unnamed protein product, partial [Ectocarpus sp. 4 AP-2014]
MTPIRTTTTAIVLSSCVTRQIAQARRRTATKNDLDGMDLG